MLTIYRSNRSEWLAKILSEQLRLDPPQPLETLEVVVNTWPISRWLGEELASSNGISALIRFPFPGKKLRELTSLVLGHEEDQSNSWTTKRLVWEVLKSFPYISNKPEGALLSEWLNKYSGSSNHVSKQTWDLALCIAKTFDEYSLYRPELLREWLSSNDPLFPQLRGDDPDILWQMSLIKSITSRIKKLPLCLQIKSAIEILKNEESISNKLPKKLFFFGIASLAPVQIEFIQALSGVIDIKVFVLTPCPDLWHRCRSRRESLGLQWKTPLETDWLIESPRLEANLGRMGAEFQQLLEGSGENQLGEWKEGDLFAAPINIANGIGRDATLIEQLQEQLIKQEGQESLHRNKHDDSLVFLACPGQWRQVQLIRDQLIQFLASDLTLEPRDILIITPQINRYAPIIASVFNDKAATGVELPWIITDRSQQDLPGITSFIFELLLLANQPLNASSLDLILSNPAFQAQQRLTEEEAKEITHYLQLTGFRWGIDESDKDGDPVHSLSWCLDRWLLGIALPEVPGLSPNNIAPFSGGLSFKKLMKWWEVLSLLSSQLHELKQPATCQEWNKKLKGSLEKLFLDGGAWSWECQNFLSALENWKVDSSEFNLKLDSIVVAEILNEELKAQSGRFGHRSGAITISGVEPMRAIPYRVIVVMGLDEDIFPRRDDRPTFNVLTQKRHLGDPNSSEKDKYVVLEALMSTRQHLLITWNCRNEKSGEHIPPSSPIQQWIGHLKNNLNEKEFSGLIRKPSPNPLSRSNFLEINNQNPISCDARNLEARMLLDKEIETQAISLAIPLTWQEVEGNNSNLISNYDLEDWLINPQLKWLEESNIKPKEWINTLKDLDSSELTELERFNIVRCQIEDFIINLPLNSSTKASFKKLSDGNIKEKYSGQGLFPKFSGELYECDLIQSRLVNLQKELNALGDCRKGIIKLKEGMKEIIWCGDCTVVIEAGQIKAKSVMKAWLQHLHLCAYKKAPEATIIVSRNNYKAKKDEYKVSARLIPLSKESAIEILNNLNALAIQGLNQCWPAPPESSWSYAIGLLKSEEKAKAAFKSKWDGGFKLSGEREKAEMRICFGTAQESNDFLENRIFIKACDSLYKPIIDNIKL